MHPVAFLPSPSQSVWHLGPLPVRAYALCIVAGIFLALWLAARRMRERGGTNEDVWDVAGWAIVFGIIGGRLYHVVTDPELYFDGQAEHQPARRGQDLGRRARHLGGDRARHAGRLDRLPPQGHLADRVRRRRRTWRAAGPRARTLGQLVQQRALRRPDQHAVGTAGPLPGHHQGLRGGRRHGIGRRAVRQRGDHAGRALPADLPLRVAVGRRDRAPAALPRSPLPPGPRQRDGALRDGLHARPGVDRGAALRPRQPHPRAAPQHLDEHHRVRPRPGLVPAPRRVPRRTRGHPVHPNTRGEPDRDEESADVGSDD